MPKLALPSLALAAILASKPCTDASQPLPSDLLTKAAVAKGLAGTARVAPDASGSCIDIDVNSVGTGRLVVLILRSLEVPYEAVRLHVVS
jgi:hypothetical protein